MQVVGTPYYMAPEQIRGENVDGRADVYALGGLLYTAVTGVSPFVAETPSDVLAQHLNNEPRPMRERVPGLTVSQELEDLVARALRKDPEQRQPSMSALAGELAACLAIEEARSRQTGRAKKAVKARKRRRAA
jgi:serine/threonine-protein kinase